MKVNDIIIRQATLNDRTKLFDFYKKVYGFSSKFKYPERWEWLYQNNPFLKSSEIPIWIAIKDAKIIGHTGSMLVPVKIKDNILIAGWSIDTIVTKDARGMGIGKNLQKANQAYNPVFMSLSYSDINEKIKIKLGALVSREFKIHRKIFKLNIDDLFVSLKLRLQSKFGQNLYLFIYYLFYYSGFLFCLKAIIQFFFKRRDKTNNKYKKLEFLEVVESFDKRADEIWERIKNTVDLQIVKDAKYLNWKYVNQPNTRYKSYYIYNKNKIIGILILRFGSFPEPKIGSIVEIISIENKEDILNEILCFAKKIFMQHNVNEIICLSTSILLSSILDKMG